MDTLSYAPKALARRTRLVRFLSDHNPFYLLSAMCMLGGCLALTNSLSWSPIRLSRLVALIATLATYESLLLVLGLYLLVRRRLVRDGLMLLVLEALFLVDAAFLNVEIFAVDLRVGLTVNAALFALGIVKVYAVFRALRLPRGGTFAFALVELAVLFAAPGVFAWVAQGRRDGAVPPEVIYAAWWAAGLLPVLSLWLVRPAALTSDGSDDARTKPARFLVRAFVAFPFCSMLLHLSMMHWVYDAHLYSGYLAPVFLGAAVVLARIAPLPVLLSRRDARVLAALLPAAAVLLSLSYPHALSFAPGGPGKLALSPPVLTAAGAYLAYVYLYFLPWAVWCVGAAAAVVLAATFGPTPSQLASGAATTWAALGGAVRRLMPKTTGEWGLVAVTAAFGFLGIGAALSLRKQMEAESPDPDGGPPTRVNVE